MEISSMPSAPLTCSGSVYLDVLDAQFSLRLSCFSFSERSSRAYNYNCGMVCNDRTGKIKATQFTVLRHRDSQWRFHHRLAGRRRSHLSLAESYPV